MTRARATIIARAFAAEPLAELRQLMMKKTLLAIAVVALYVLHQDFWNWRTPRPLVFGFVPVGLFYHAVFSVACAGLMWLLVRFAWPAHLEDEVEESPRAEGGSPK
jgi:hypothetical protein